MTRRGGWENTRPPADSSEASFDVRMIGRGERIRTFDLLNPIQVRYQAALRPDRGSQSTTAPRQEPHDLNKT